ncbi:MAG: hypothetical protein DRP15_04305 [Candidatus Aenigmatarchaeota archaeon]|nr:MAG: hypothetical protein DRP15_04305 [Candidatus Aenigmarchaeota archaeon]
MTDGITAKIVEGIAQRLNEGGIEVKHIDEAQIWNNSIGALSRPSINISVNSGSFDMETQREYKNKLLITLYLYVSDSRGEKKRRHKIYDLIDAIIFCLFMEKLGLPLQDPLIPINYSNVTDAEAAGRGCLRYQINFECSYNFKHIPDNEKDLGRLKAIVCDYYIQPDDGVSDSSSSTSLTGIDGGNAFSDYGRSIDGGNAGSSYGGSYDGGKAKSIY